MAPLEQVEEDSISASVLQELSETLYACSSLTQLTGGSANFVYRGILARPLPAQGGSTVKSVIIKHSRDFVAINRDFPLDLTRCTFEVSMLDAVAGYSPPDTTAVVIKTSRIYLFNRQTNTQVLEDFPDTDDLKSVFFSPDVGSHLPSSSAAIIGHHLGSWLRSFHAWASAPKQASMRAAIGQNLPMRELKCMTTYGSFLTVLEKFPELLVGCGETLEIVRDVMSKEFGKPPVYGDKDEDWGIIHGDYWSGNVLFPNTPWREPGAGTNKLFIIDWEFAQYGHRAYDLGQIIGDLYERKIFNDIDTVMPVMQGVIEGYGELSDDMAFRTAIHAGVQLIGWYNRRPRTGALMTPPEVIVAGLTIGRDFILKGWEKDSKFFERNALASLFAAK